MKTIITTITFLILGFAAFAQTPQTFNYQAVLRDASGGILANQQVEIVVTLLQGSVTGTEIFTETHSVTTNNFGLANLQIGSVNTTGMQNIDWSSGSYFIQISVDGTIMGTSQLLSVPYALHAVTVENDKVDDADADPGNELQILSISNDTIYLSNGGKVKLPPETDPAFTYWDKSTGITITESQISDLNHFTGDDISGNETAFDGWDKDASDDFTTADETDPIFSSSLAAAITAADTAQWAKDNDPQNELQRLYLENQLLSISNGNTIDLSEAFIVDSSASKNLQDISLNGTLLSITKGSTVDLSGVQDGDKQRLSLGVTNQHEIRLNISNANFVEMPFIKDGVSKYNWSEAENYVAKWGQYGAMQKSTIYDNGNIGIGTEKPSAKLEVAGQVKITGGEPGNNKILVSDANGLATWKPNLDNDPTNELELPSQTGNAGKYLTTNGSVASWEAISTAHDALTLGTANGLSLSTQQLSLATATTSSAGALSSSDKTKLNKIASTRTTASGYNSTAMGYETTASRRHSTAMGYKTTASGNMSTAMGYKTTASGDGSTAMGNCIKASGYNSFGIGLDDTERTLSKDSTMAIMGGNVGIGTTSPSKKLHVYQNDEGQPLLLETNGDYAGIALKNNTKQWVLNNSTKGFGIWDDAASAYRMLIDDAGDVGIGTTSPSKKLHVYQNDEGQPLLLETNGDYAGIALKNNTKQWVLNNSTKGFGIWDDAASAYRMLIDDAGDVGIGATSPSKKLHVYQDDEGQPLLLETNGDYAGFALKNNTKQWALNNSTKGFGIWDDAASAYRMLIDDDGDVGIGTTSPSYKLDVDGTIRATSDISAEDDVFVNDNLYANNIYTKFGGTSEQVYYRLYGSMGVVGYNSTGSATPSDKRLKENIQTITNPLEKLELLRGVTYNWNQKAKDYFIKDIEKNVGFVDSLSEAEKEVLLEKEKQKVLEEANRNTMSFIAQEVVENFPQWVKENEDGVKLIDMKGINSLLVEAVKELKTEKDAEIAQLKQTIENLQNANTALKAEKDYEIEGLQQRLETLEALVKNTLNTIAEEKASAQK